MDEILAIIMQDNAYRELAKIKTYPIPTTNPVNQLITSQVEVDKITETAQREVDNIMAIAFPSDLNHRWPQSTLQPHRQPSQSHPQPPRPPKQLW